MELYHCIDLATSEKCYERGRIRSVIVDEWEHLVEACDKDGILRVKDERSDLTGEDCGSHRDSHQETNNSMVATSGGKKHAGDKHAGDDDSCSRFSSRHPLEDVPPEDGPDESFTEPDDISSFDSSSEVEILSINDENGLFFRPDCTSLCITKSDNHDHPCHKGHTNVLHASLNRSGDYVLFPAMTFHRGYYNPQVDKTFITAQLFAVLKSPYMSRQSRKSWNDSRFYKVQGVLPEKLSSLREDLLAYWDEHYPCSSYAPPDRYKNTKIDTKSNRVIQKKHFTTMPHVLELVTMFENIYHELEIESVWFIRKSRRGDGFQRWHQDLVGTGTTIATIVINIASVDKKDEEFEVENILRLNKDVIDVFQQCTEDAQETVHKDKDEQQKSNEVSHVTSSFRFSTANKAPPPNVLADYARRANERMNNIVHSKSVTATEVVDVVPRKSSPENVVHNVLQNFVTASNAVDIDDQKRPPEIVNEVPKNSAIATEAVDIDDRKRSSEIVNEVPKNSAIATEAVDIDDRKRSSEIVNEVPKALDFNDRKYPQEIVNEVPKAVDFDERKRTQEIINEVPKDVNFDNRKRAPEIVPLLAQAKANMREYEWNTHLIHDNHNPPPLKYHPCIHNWHLFHHFLQ
jgi:hypothetical protein